MTKAIAERYAEEAWNRKDLSVIDELVDEKVVIHSLLGNFYGIDAMKNIVSAWITGFPDLKVTTKDTIHENDRTMLHWAAEGTHLGTFKEIPATGRHVHYRGVTIYRIANAKIVDYWAYLDMHNLLDQIRPRTYFGKFSP